MEIAYSSGYESTGTWSQNILRNWVPWTDVTIFQQR
ncbi:hypothetical protein C7972_10598 [Arenibacter sp. ARW7G5Y1]|nr:hypothetical protein C7972_10598 [Arenibacter sp. ARW7G5Y1]